MPHSLQNTCAALAPGKLILSGEHAVVHGQPALAVAVDTPTRAIVRQAEGEGLTVLIPRLRRVLQYGVGQMRNLAPRLEARHAEFLACRRPIREVLDDPFDLIAYAVARVARRVEREVKRCQVEVEIGPPLGCGMGSSAAVGLAVLAAGGCWFGGRRLDLAELIEESIAVEQLQHGNPSGVDSFVCACGGACRYTRGQPGVPVPLPPLSLRLVHTGTPESTTGECVSRVRETHGKSAIWEQFGEITREVEEALLREDQNALLAAVRRNHRLLVEIGVVPKRVQAFIVELERVGLAAKICGAGAVGGAGGGMVWVTGSSPPDALCRSFNYQPINLQVDQHGTRIVDGFGAR